MSVLTRAENYSIIKVTDRNAAVNRAFNETSTLDKLSAELESITKTDEYDEMGLLKKTDVHRAGKTVLSHTYGYSLQGNKINGFVSRETIKYGAETAMRIYSRDALGRITNITDFKNGLHKYSYDKRGFITSADKETFEYDTNGNITKYDGAVFGYDSVIKDKLVSVGGNAVTYASASSLNPTSWNGRSYGYEGRRLTSFNYNGKSCTYDYDEQSHRIFKSVNGAVTRYIYSGDNLVIEDGPNGKLFFLYDENGQLYGFVKDGKRYFYIKDITGTILGIADESGDILGKYEYSAYGKCTVTDNTNNTNNIAEINPFRFKCYYYDAESGMYYCHTRYLVPEWGRWLNTDNPGFLQFDNINGMNLFAYCNNNPVMYSDPSGQFISILIGALIGGIFGAIEGAISAKATGRDVGWGIVLGALGGAIIGGLASFLGGSVALTGMKLIKSVSIIGGASLVVGGATEALNQVINGEDISCGNIIMSGIKSAVSNTVSFLFANYLSTISKDAFDIFGTTLGTSIIFFGINSLFNTKDFYEYGKKLKEKY